MPEARGGPLPFTLGEQYVGEVGANFPRWTVARGLAFLGEKGSRGAPWRRLKGRERGGRENGGRTRRGFQVLAAVPSGLSKALNSSQVSRGKTMWPKCEPGQPLRGKCL